MGWWAVGGGRRAGQFCRDMNDYCDAFAIVNGLLSPAVHRLRKSWEGLPNRERAIQDMFQKLMDPSSNMRIYREAYEKVNKPPCIPFFRTYTLQGRGKGGRSGKRSGKRGLTACVVALVAAWAANVVVSDAAIVQRELLYIYERNESVVQGLINYKKFELMAFHMMRFIKFQSEVRTEGIEGRHSGRHCGALTANGTHECMHAWPHALLSAVELQHAAERGGHQLR